MAENETSHPGQGFAIAGFIIGILAIILAFIPCTGFGPLAILLSLISLIISIFGFYKGRLVKSLKGLVLAALIISVIAVFSSMSRYFMVQGMKNKTGMQIEDNNWSKEMDQTIDQINEDDLFDDEDLMTDKPAGKNDSNTELNKAIDEELKKKENQEN